MRRLLAGRLVRERAAVDLVTTRVAVTCPACARPVLLTLGLPDGSLTPGLCDEIEARTTDALWLHVQYGCQAQAGGDGRPVARSL